MEIFDSHTHFFSYAFFKALVAQKDPRAEVASVLGGLAQKTGIEIPDQDIKLHTKKWLAEMDQHQIKNMVTFASLPQEMETVAEAVQSAGGRLVGFTLVNPLLPEAKNFVKYAAGQGFRGILLFPVMHGYHIYDERLEPIFRVVQEEQMAVLVHFGLLQVKLRDLLGLPRPYDLRYGNPLDLQSVANRFPKVNLIIPHFGCGFFRETLMLGSQCENVVVDTSSSNNWLETQPERLTLADIFLRVLNVFGAQRILFGTDSGTFPRGWRKDIFEEQQRAMREAGLSEEDQRFILAGNIKRILKI